MQNRLIFSSILLVVLSGAISCAPRHVEPGSEKNYPSYEKSLVAEETARGEKDTRSVSPEAEAQYQFLLGQLALNEEKYPQALTHFQKASNIEKGPAPTLRRNLAQLYVRLGQVDKALGEVEKALEQDPNDIELLQLRAGILATKRDFPKAIEAYKKVIALSPADHEDSYVLIASLYAQEGNVDSAKVALRELMAKNPNSFFGHYYFGRMSEASGDAAGAEESYKKALSINPQADAVNLDLARVYGVQKRFREAIELCERVVKDNPRNVAARNLLAQLLMGDNRVDKAIQEFETVGTLEEDPTETRLKIALIKLQRRDIEGAITELNLVLSQHEDNATAHYYLASAYAGLKKTNDALAEIKRISSADEYFVESRVLGAFMLQQDKRYPEAIDLINDALTAKKEEVKLLGLRATMEHEAGNDEAAVETTLQLIKLAPTEDKYQFTLGVYLDELGKKDEALKAMQRAIELDPKNANALNYLGYSLAERGEKLDEAEALIKRALEVEKGNGYYLDSLGWLYHQQGKYREAGAELEKAVAAVPTDSVILEHYATILIKLNNKKKALEVIQKALLHVGESDDKGVGERLKSLLEKLEK